MTFVRTSSVRSSMKKKMVVDPTEEFRAQNRTDGMSMIYLHWYATDGAMVTPLMVTGGVMVTMT